MHARHCCWCCVAPRAPPAGSYFGERALITDEPRAATITAVADSKCLAMDRAAFLRLLGPITDLLARNLDMYTRYTRKAPPPGAAAGGTAAAEAAAGVGGAAAASGRV